MHFTGNIQGPLWSMPPPRVCLSKAARCRHAQSLLLSGMFSVMPSLHRMPLHTWSSDSALLFLKRHHLTKTSTDSDLFEFNMVVGGVPSLLTNSFSPFRCSPKILRPVTRETKDASWSFSKA